MEKMVLDKKGILEYQRNRDPYLMIDFAEEVIPGVSAKGYKDLKEDDWFFKCHWEGDPNMPGMLQIEALVQMAALSVLTLPGNKGKVVYLTSADNIKLSKKIVAGDRLCIETKLNSWKRGIGNSSGRGSVNGQAACSADFTFIMPDVLEGYKVVSKKGDRDVAIR
jgi:3-hydroxyacyl-[acyl-carrier-protein] dehydratase